MGILFLVDGVIFGTAYVSGAYLRLAVAGAQGRAWRLLNSFFYLASSIWYGWISYSHTIMSTPAERIFGAVPEIVLTLFGLSLGWIGYVRLIKWLASRLAGRS